MSPPDPTTLTLHEAAERLGVHYMTAYRYVRLGMLPATKRGRAWVVEPDDLEAFLTPPTGVERGSAPWDQRLLNRMLAADDAGAWAVVEAALASGSTVADVYTRMIIPALRSIGDGWAGGDIDVATEHAATQIAGRIVARLSPRMVHRGVKRGTIIIGSTATEMHNLPISIMADLLRDRNFNVIDLGGNLPPSDFASAVASADNVVAAAIGVTSSDQQEEISRTVAAIREVSEAPILVGGGGITDELVPMLDADVVATTGEEAIAAIEDFAAAAP